MLRRLSRLRGTGACLLLSVAWLGVSSCAVPLGPRFVVERQQIDVRYPAEREPHIEVSASFYLRNTGNRPLSSIELDLPDTRKYLSRQLRVQIDRRVVTTTAVESQENRIRLPMDPALAIKEGRELFISYELVAPAKPSAPFLAPDAFFLDRGGWYPALIQPKTLLSIATGHPRKWNVSLQVPNGFLAHAPGRALGTRKQSAEIRYRFEMGRRDFEPFLVAGRYQEQRVRTIDGPMIFWTRQSLPPDQLQGLAEPIAAAVKTYQDEFGRRAQKPLTIWIVECAAEEPLAHSADEESLHSTACPGLPDVAQIPSSLLRKGAPEESFLADAEYKLAHGWFSRPSALNQTDELLPMSALPSYAVLTADVAREGEPTRQRHAARLLKRYDRAFRQGPEKRLTSVGPGDPIGQRISGYARSEMFFLALEDAYGKQALHRALARMIGALPNERWTANDLLAGLELERGKNLADFFRLWLNRPGIPAGFRARYEEKTSFEVEADPTDPARTEMYSIPMRPYLREVR